MNTQKLTLMTEGGKRLGSIKHQLADAVKAGVTQIEIDSLADKLIVRDGDYPSFKTVKGYHNATCININEEVVHGIPKPTPFKPGDVVTIDLGLVHKGWHLDTSLTLQLPPIDPKVTKFLDAGKQSLKEAIAQALPGNSIYQISKAMQQAIEKEGYHVIRDLTGHGVGRQLHEHPSIPCYADSEQKHEILKPGQSVAIEVMYSMGDWRLKLADDGWTLSTADGSLSGMFEESVFITEEGQIILTL